MQPPSLKTSVRMRVLVLIFLVLFRPSAAEDTVSEDVGPQQLRRLVELLTGRECEELISAMARPEESIFQRLDRLSAERNQILRSRRRRNTEAACRSALKDWLQTHGEQIFFSRLSRALQQIGRIDIAIEVGKNINQDKTLAIQRYVEGYHELVSQMEKHHEDHGKQYSAKQARGFTWRDVDLMKWPSAQRPRLLTWAWPVLLGLLLGLASSLLMGMAILLISIYVSHGNRSKSRSGHQTCRLGVETSSHTERVMDAQDNNSSV